MAAINLELDDKAFAAYLENSGDDIPLDIVPSNRKAKPNHACAAFRKDGKANRTNGELSFGTFEPAQTKTKLSRALAVEIIKDMSEALTKRNTKPLNDKASVKPLTKENEETLVQELNRKLGEFMNRENGDRE